jgi:hypothetical protein
MAPFVASGPAETSTRSWAKLLIGCVVSKSEHAELLSRRSLDDNHAGACE